MHVSPRFTLASIDRAARAMVLSTFLIAGAAQAQQTGGIVTLESVSGAPGNTVSVTFEFDNTDNADSLEARARIQGIEAFSQVDVSDMCESSTAFFASCQLNDTNRIVVAVANLTGMPIASFSGSIAFTIDPATPDGTDVALEWDAPEDEGRPFTPSKAIDGLVSVEVDGPLISLEPGALDFGELEAGQTSTPLTIQAVNSGNADGLIIEGVSTDITDFTIADNGCDQVTLAEGQTCSIEVVFAPESDTERSGQLLVATNVGTRSGELTGTGIAPRLTADPEAGEVDFGLVAPGDNASVSGQFTNSGTAPLDIECNLAAGAGEFQTQPDPLSWAGIAPSDAVDFTLVFAPTSGEQQSAVLDCQSNAVDQPQFQYLLTAPGIFIFTDRFEP